MRLRGLKMGQSCGFFEGRRCLNLNQGVAALRNPFQVLNPFDWCVLSRNWLNQPGGFLTPEFIDVPFGKTIFVKQQQVGCTFSSKTNSGSEKFWDACETCSTQLPSGAVCFFFGEVLPVKLDQPKNNQTPFRSHRNPLGI